MKPLRPQLRLRTQHAEWLCAGYQRERSLRRWIRQSTTREITSSPAPPAARTHGGTPLTGSIADEASAHTPSAAATTAASARGEGLGATAARYRIPLARLGCRFR